MGLSLSQSERGVAHDSLENRPSGCEISTGPGTNASEMLVGPVKNLVYFQLN